MVHNMGREIYDKLYDSQASDIYLGAKVTTDILLKSHSNCFIPVVRGGDS